MKLQPNVKWWFELHGTKGVFQFDRQSRPEVYRFTGTVNSTPAPPLYAAKHVATYVNGQLTPVNGGGLWIEEDRRIKTVNHILEA